jgi:undecaprenyl-diphosphatase
MYSIFHSVVLGAIQGLTEFLPVSSSGHLVLLEKFFKISDNLVLLNLVLHLGTALAAMLFFWRDIWNIIVKRDWNMVKNLFIALLTTTLIGLLIKNMVENMFIYSSNIKPVLLGMAFTAIILFISTKINKSRRDLNTLTIIEAVKIGLIQAIAIIPGISRSGLTYFITLQSGIKKEEAFKFSFLLAIPTIFGAALVETITNYGHLTTNNHFWPLIIGLIISFIFGILGLWIFKRVIKTSKIWVFGVYLIILATWLWFR